MQAGRRKEVSALPNAWSKDVGGVHGGNHCRPEGISAGNSTWLSRPGKEKRCKKWFGFGLDLNSFWLHFGTWRHFFRRKGAISIRTFPEPQNAKKSHPILNRFWGQFGVLEALKISLNFSCFFKESFTRFLCHVGCQRLPKTRH